MVGDPPPDPEPPDELPPVCPATGCAGEHSSISYEGMPPDIAQRLSALLPTLPPLLTGGTKVTIVHDTIDQTGCPDPKRTDIFALEPHCGFGILQAVAGGFELRLRGQLLFDNPDRLEFAVTTTLATVWAAANEPLMLASYRERWHTKGAVADRCVPCPGNLEEACEALDHLTDYPNSRVAAHLDFRSTVGALLPAARPYGDAGVRWTNKRGETCVPTAREAWVRRHFAPAPGATAEPFDLHVTTVDVAARCGAVTSATVGATITPGSPAASIQQFFFSGSQNTGVVFFPDSTARSGQPGTEVTFDSTAIAGLEAVFLYSTSPLTGRVVTCN